MGDAIMKTGMMLGSLALAAVAPMAASAQVTQTTTVQASADLYRASDGAGAAFLDGTDPVVINLGSATSITFSVVANGVTVNHGTGDTPNNADGIGNSNAETNTGYGTWSGIKAPNAGFLAGVFTSPSVVRTTQQAGLDFTSAGIGTDFTSLSPLNYQVFFIGDGKTSGGVTQTFVIPTAGTIGRQLVLGLTDACSYSGGPSCYNDNLGTFTVTYTLNGVATPVPEAATWALMIAGFGMVGFALRRRVRASEIAFDARIKRMTAGEID